MNERERAQVERIVAQELKTACSDILASTELIYRKQSAAGMLASGNTVAAIINELTINADGLANTLHEKVRQVASDREAFETVSRGVLACLEACKEQLPRLVAMTGGEDADRVEAAANELLEESLLDIQAKLEIAAYYYQKPTASVDAAPGVSIVNRGGRPRAAFWEAMWAAIAAKLINGDLDPKTQADVERAMANGSPQAVMTRRRALSASARAAYGGWSARAVSPFSSSI